MSALTLDACWQVARRTWIKTWRRPVVLTFSLAQPLWWMLLFGFLFQRFPLDDAAPSYLGFLAPGVCAMTVLFGASQAGIGWIRDLQTGFLERLLYDAASPHPLLLGKLLAEVARLLVQAGLVLALALMLGFRPVLGWAWLPGVAALALLAASFASISSIVALRAGAQEAMAAYVHLINMPLLFTSTALVPHRHMPEWLAAIAAWNPLTLAVEAWRGALLADRVPDLSDLAALALLAVVAYALALRALERRA